MARKRKVLVIVNAGTLAGWRRASASLAQLHQAVADLRAQDPGAAIAVIGDAALKWDLPANEQAELETDIVEGEIVFAPAGANDGHVGFMGRVVDKARALGFTPIAITDQAIPGCPLGRVRRDGEQWIFDLDGYEATVQAETTAQAARGRRKR